MCVMKERLVLIHRNINIKPTKGTAAAAQGIQFTSSKDEIHVILQFRRSKWLA